MAAVVEIKRWTGLAAGPTKDIITSINTRANAEDTNTPDGTTNSILIPAGGSNYSYWVETRLYVTSISLGTVDNLRWYSDGTNNFGTDVTCVGYSAAGYVQATGTPGTTGDPLTKASGSLREEPVDVFGLKVGSPLSLTGTTIATGDFGDFFVYQIVVGSTAVSGATAAETFTWKYDDTSS